QVRQLASPLHLALGAVGETSRAAAGEGEVSGEPTIHSTLNLGDNPIVGLVESPDPASAVTRAFVERLVKGLQSDLTKEQKVSRTHDKLWDNASGDPHSQYVSVSIARVITAIHTFSPHAPGVPFILGAN